MKKQFNSTKNKYGINLEKIEACDDELYFNESFTICGESIRAKEIYGSYDLTFLGNVEAEKIETYGVLYVVGDLIANMVRARKIICSGQIKVCDLFCDDEIISDSLNVNNADLTGNVLVNRSISVLNKFSSEANVLCGEGIIGSEYSAKTTVVIDYFDVDDKSAQNYIEIEEEFKNTALAKSNNGDESINNTVKKLKKILNDSISNVNDEDELVEMIEEAAKEDFVSFDIMEYVLKKIIDISYQNEIENLNQYLYVMFASKKFPINLKGYETVEHIFNDYLPRVKAWELSYKANSLKEFIVCLYINNLIFNDDEVISDKIFSSIGIKYSTVKKQLLNNNNGKCISEGTQASNQKDIPNQMLYTPQNEDNSDIGKRVNSKAFGNGTIKFVKKSSYVIDFDCGFDKEILKNFVKFI